MNPTPGSRGSVQSPVRDPGTGAKPLPRFGTEYRADLQGMRAVAVLLVLLYHAGLPWFSGGFVGVDVFFVLSGYLITGIVAREIHERGSLSISRFYARRILRIIPAATIVLVAVAVATVLWLPITRWRSIASEIIGSAFYVSNWQFAASTNYLNASTLPSPLQHFWSLAVEEQYYLLWPALLVLGFLLIRHRANGERRTRLMLHVALAVMLAITLVSFACSVVLMQTRPDPAYFITPTRLWELGIGSLLALAVPRLRSMPLLWSRLLAVGGLLAVLGAGILYDRSVPFPGATALLPVLGTAAMIAGGVSVASAERSHRVLGNRAMVWVGDLSYALYLWHWPLLIIGQQGFGLTGAFWGLALVAFAILPAYLSTRFLEKPIARNQALRGAPKRAFRLGIAAILCSLLAAGAVVAALKWNTQAPTDIDIEKVGAATLSEGELPQIPDSVPRDLVPSLIDAKDDIPPVYEAGCHLEVPDTEPVETGCSFGEEDGPLVLLVGDSHAAQWFSALEQYAKSNGMRLVSMTKSSCPFADLTIELTGKERPYAECAEWNAQLRNYIERERPVAVFTGMLGLYVDAERPEDDDALQQGLRRSWEWTASLGSEVVVLTDSPYMGFDVPECLAQHMQDPSACGVSRSAAFPYDGLEDRAAKGLDGVEVVDVNDRICPGEQCEPIIGSVLVYRDQHHLSDTYVRSLAAVLSERIGSIPAR